MNLQNLQDKRHQNPRWNTEIYNLYKDLNTVDDIKIIRLGLTGHTIRMEDERIPEKDLNGTFHNTRLRQEDAVRWDTSQILEIQGWRR